MLMKRLDGLVSEHASCPPRSGHMAETMMPRLAFLKLGPSCVTNSGTWLVLFSSSITSPWYPLSFSQVTMAVVDRLPCSLLSITASSTPAVGTG